MTEFTVITHYSTDDQDCSGDYVDIELNINGCLYYTAGDHYHDKGRDRVEGYIAGWCARASLSEEEFEIKYVDVADREI